MIDDVFVFDGVAHIFNFEQKNAFGTPGEMFSNHLYAFHNALTPDDQTKLPAVAEARSRVNRAAT
jgi:hypothetical protein